MIRNFLIMTIVLVGYIVLPRIYIFDQENIELSVGDIFVADLYLDNDSLKYDTILIVKDDYDCVVFAIDYSDYTSENFIKIDKCYLEYCIIK